MSYMSYMSYIGHMEEIFGFCRMIFENSHLQCAKQRVCCSPWTYYTILPSYIYIPGTCLSSILVVEPSKTRSFPIKTRVIWVPGIYIYIYKYIHLPIGTHGTVYVYLHCYMYQLSTNMTFVIKYFDIWYMWIHLDILVYRPVGSSRTLQKQNNFKEWMLSHTSLTNIP